MERVRDDKEWTLFCPDECQTLSKVYGDQFNQLYGNLELQGVGTRTVSVIVNCGMLF